jgi:hypothetical protein
MYISMVRWYILCGAGCGVNCPLTCSRLYCISQWFAGVYFVVLVVVWMVLSLALGCTVYLNGSLVYTLWCWLWCEWFSLFKAALKPRDQLCEECLILKGLWYCFCHCEKVRALPQQYIGISYCMVQPTQHSNIMIQYFHQAWYTTLYVQPSSQQYLLSS